MLQLIGLLYAIEGPVPLAAEQFPSLQKLWADAAYQGLRVELLAQQVWAASPECPPQHPLT